MYFRELITHFVIGNIHEYKPKNLKREPVFHAILPSHGAGGGIASPDIAVPELLIQFLSAMCWISSVNLHRIQGYVIK